jgi:hypothetical protein
MKPDKKSTRRVLKTPTNTSKPVSVAPVTTPAGKPKRVAKTAVQAQPAAAPKPAAASKSKRTPRVATEAQPQGASQPELATKSKRPVRTARPTAAPGMKSRRVTRSTRQPKLEIPPILLAGDAPPRPAVSGPGQRYALGPTVPAPASGVETSDELPESYGTAKLWLAARDPHWLYAYWDLSSEQLRHYNQSSDDGHLIVRVFEKEFVGEPLLTQHVHPESRNWFVHVPRAGTKYVAQLGFFDRQERWQTIALSPATVTPPDSLSEDTSADFATLPSEVPFEQLVEMVKTVISQNVPLMEALAQLRAEGHENLPTADTFAPPPPVPSARGRTSQAATPAAPPAESAGPAPAPNWTPAQAKALAEVITMDEVRRVWIGSMEITELVRRSLMKELSDQTAAQLAAGQGGVGLGSPSSPFGALSSLGAAPGAAAGGKSGFWFNINAELIIYGATEPDATVTIGGRKIRLRPDGSFSYRFALPDGKYDLPAIAVSAAGDDQRSAELHFQRRTRYSGDVGTHPQDASLRPPKPEHVA